MTIRFEKYIELLHNYKNRGQDAEQSYVYDRTGILAKADNISAYDKADFENIQIKSARGSICKGSTKEDLMEHLNKDKAEIYVYVCKDGAVFNLDKEAYFEFALMFSEVTKDSTGKNGGATKMRFGRRFTEMRRYLEKNS